MSAPVNTRLSPFLVLGDPTPDHTVELARRAVEAGAGALELGFPYSDPTADGPAVAAASQRALDAGVSTGRALELLAAIRAEVEVPLNLLVYANLVHARGYARFARDVRAAGASSLLVPDIGLEESTPLFDACREVGLARVLLAGPATDSERLKRMDRAVNPDEGGFLYLVSHQGTTGARRDFADAALQRVREVCAAVQSPVAVGFGLSRPEHVRAVADAGASLAVVGSALVSLIPEAPDRETLLTTWTDNCRALAAPLLQESSRC